MSLSKNILRDGQGYASFLDRLKTSHEVQDELPANLYTKSQIQKRFQDAHTNGLTTGQQEGYKAGREQGYKAGLEAGKAEAAQAFEEAHQAALDAFTQQLDELKTEAVQATAQWFVDAEKQLSQLAIEIARRAIGEELNLREEAVVEIANQVLSEVTEGTHFRIRVNLAEAPLIESRRQQLIESISHVRDIEIVSDPSVQTGCIVETGSSTIDARIESYLARLADNIREEAA